MRCLMCWFNVHLFNLFVLSYIFIGATIFGRWEDWSKLDGCYFCFISLSSIGFGDIVPGEEVNTIYIYIYNKLNQKRCYLI